MFTFTQVEAQDTKRFIESLENAQVVISAYCNGLKAIIVDETTFVLENGVPQVVNTEVLSVVSHLELRNLFDCINWLYNDALGNRYKGSWTFPEVTIGTEVYAKTQQDALKHLDDWGKERDLIDGKFEFIKIQ